MNFKLLYQIPKLYGVAIYEKVTELSKAGGVTLKEYVNEPENINNISLVVYDMLPLPIKLGIRYEKFNRNFVKSFDFIKEKIFNIKSEEVIEIEQSVIKNRKKKLK